MPEGWDPNDKSHKTLISCSDVLVRGVDNNYIYIYVSDPKVLEIIKSSYPETEITEEECKPLDEYEVPF